jgi:PelA/Pel-15E family pectate lyase
VIFLPDCPMKTTSFVLLVFTLLATTAQAAVVEWRKVSQQPAAWFATAEARAVADSVLLYQYPSGGWPKNIDMARPLNAGEKADLAERSHDDATIDNGATHTQIRFLARMAGLTGGERYRAAVLLGLDYLLEAQYPNGGWPQFFPLRKGYYTHITFNDDAMIKVLEVLRDAAAAREEFSWVDEPRRARATDAVRRGVDCILRCQIVIDGVKTAWCAQHDEVTFAPAPARKYEHASLTGFESVGIVRFLMSLDRPTPEVIQAIAAAVAWLDHAKITGVRIENPPAPTLPHGHDRVVVADPAAPPIWARFYELRSMNEAARPIFSGRDGVIRFNLSEIEAERRGGYRWYIDEPLRLLEKDYPRWRAKHKIS